MVQQASQMGMLLCRLRRHQPHPHKCPQPGPCPRPSHCAAAGRREGERARPGTPLRKPLQPFRTENFLGNGSHSQPGDAANCKGAELPHTCPPLSAHWPTHLRGPGVEYIDSWTQILKQNKTQTHIRHQDDGFIHCGSEGNLMEKQACKETGLMTSTTLKKQCAHLKKSNLECRFWAGNQAPHRPRAMGGAWTRVLLPPQWCTLRIFSSWVGEVWSELHHIWKLEIIPLHPAKTKCLSLFSETETLYAIVASQKQPFVCHLFAWPSPDACLS